MIKANTMIQGKTIQISAGIFARPMLVTIRRSLQGTGQRPALKSLRTPQANEQTDPALSHDNLPIFVPLKQARYQQLGAIEPGAITCRSD
jgi:hypothetical protein